MPIQFLHDEPQIVPGIKCAAVEANIKKKGRLDLVLFDIGPDATSSCVTTSNALAASPVLLTRKHQQAMPSRYWIINTGYANAAMGKAGDLAALEVVTALAKALNTPVESILPFSTGVIGEPLPVEKIVAAIPALTAGLTEDQWLSAVQGIVTTDTQYKLVSKTFVWQEKAFIIQGIAKGAGMIKPNMATMLGFVATDLKIPQAILEPMLKHAIDQSFNAISVDGDTSTNDCVAFAATGQSELTVNGHPDFQRFVQECLNKVCLELSLQVVKDGEGATKILEITCRGAANVTVAKAVAESIGHSPLVKTACFASDPNWGRILMAIGKTPDAGVDPNNLDVRLGGKLLFTEGGRIAGYVESEFAAIMEEQHIQIDVDLKQGSDVFTCWTNDLSYEYVKINADYRS